MEAKDLLKHALELPPEDRFALVDGILQSLDEPDKTIDELWLDEAERRLNAFQEGRIRGVKADVKSDSDIRSGENGSSK